MFLTVVLNGRTYRVLIVEDGQPARIVRILRVIVEAKRTYERVINRRGATADAVRAAAMAELKRIRDHVKGNARPGEQKLHEPAAAVRFRSADRSLVSGADCPRRARKRPDRARAVIDRTG